METLNQKLKIFDTLLEPVFALDSEAQVLYANPAGCTLSELSLRKITRSGRFDQIFQFNPGESPFTEISLIDDPTPYRELHFRNLNAEEKKAQITIQKFSDTEAKVWLVFFRDVTLEETLQKKYRAELDQKLNYIQELEKAQDQLEETNRNLELRVEERTAEIKQMNKTMTTLLDSLDQGFFLFDESGTCLDVASKACLSILEKDPKGLKIWQVLGVEDHKVEGFQKWLITVFSEMLPFEDLAPLGPQSYLHSKGRHILLNYFPLRDDTSAIKSIVVVATDTTHLDEARAQAEKEKQFAQMVIQMTKKRKEITRFIGESKKLISQLLKALENQSYKDKELIFRLIHTIKGGAATFAVPNLPELCHQAEDILTPLNPEEASSSWHALNLKSKEIEKAFTIYLNENEPILGSSAIQGIRSVEVSYDLLNSIFHRLNKIHQTTHIAAELEKEVLCSPIGESFLGFQEVIDQTASITGKSVAKLKLINEKIPVRSEIYADLFATLVHQFRNAVDHGIELPEQRLQNGKSPEGQVTVTFKVIESSGAPFLLVAISDDGAGINPESIRQKLKKNGIDASDESDEEVIQHIFDSQFSTKDSVSATSGRGVGADAIMYSSRKLNGRAWVTSELNKGTTLFIEVPYITESSLGKNQYAKAS